MCGRYTGYVDDAEEIKSIYLAARSSYPDVKFSEGEIYPTNTVPLLSGGGMEPFPAAWGFPGYKGKGVIINARAETAAEKPLFCESLQNRRCAIPTTGYYEWSPEKLRYRFNLPGEETLYLAGFYRRFDDGLRFVVLTTSANESASAVHSRMPVILPKPILKMWAVDTEAALAYLHEEMPSLISRQT